MPEIQHGWQTPPRNGGLAWYILLINDLANERGFNGKLWATECIDGPHPFFPRVPAKCSSLKNICRTTSHLHLHIFTSAHLHFHKLTITHMRKAPKTMNVRHPLAKAPWPPSVWSWASGGFKVGPPHSSLGRRGLFVFVCPLLLNYCLLYTSPSPRDA